jgi:hypothetical protein
MKGEENMSKQYPNIVPAGDKTQSLGTSEKRWAEVHAGTIEGEDFAGRLAEIIDSLATKTALAEVEGKIGTASAPLYFTLDTPFAASGKRAIKTPNILWLNINGKGHKLTSALTFDIDTAANWDLKATTWSKNTSYTVGDYVTPTDEQGIYCYKATTSGTTSATLTPEWPQAIGEKVNDGEVVWECCTNPANPANRAGKDFYLYAIYSTADVVPQFTFSANSTVPERYDADMTRKICGFHCLCVDVGTIDGHALTGYVAGDVLPASVWDLYHRPKSEPESMVYDRFSDTWLDIYGDSWDGKKLVSVYGGAWADGASEKKWHGEASLEQLMRQGKRLPWRYEFQMAARGSNEGTNIKGSADPNTTGGHVDTAGRRMISDIGLEDCCGVLWQWGNDLGFADGSGWTDSVYSASVDDKRYGQTYGNLFRLLFGARWSHGASCGSRSAYCYGVSSYVSANCGCRGASEPLHRQA